MFKYMEHLLSSAEQNTLHKCVINNKYINEKLDIRKGIVL